MQDATAIPADYKFVAMTANFWGGGKTKDEAMRNMRNAGGDASVRKYGFVLYRAHPKTTVCGINGGFEHPVGSPPVKIEDRRKTK